MSLQRNLASEPAGAVAPGDAVPAERRARRLAFLKWLRLVHLYLGLWGAALGLLFGATGVVLNHRSILKIPVERNVQRVVQVAVPSGGFASPDELSRWLQAELRFVPAQAPLVRREPAKPVFWGERELVQPERWSVSLQGPRRSVGAEHFAGNRFATLTHNDATLIGTLTRLHTASGVDAAWVLLSDSIAGALIALCISGLLLWTQLRALRTAGVLTSAAALLIAAAWFAGST